MRVISSQEYRTHRTELQSRERCARCGLCLRVILYGSRPPCQRRAPKGKRLKRLSDGALAAPSHALVKIIHLSSGRRYPICGLRPVPDVPAGPILASEVGGPKCKIWDAIGSDLLAGGAGGARLADPRIGSGPTWPRAEHEAAKCAAPSPKIEPFLGGATRAPRDQTPSVPR